MRECRRVHSPASVVSSRRAPAMLGLAYASLVGLYFVYSSIARGITQEEGPGRGPQARYAVRLDVPEGMAVNRARPVTFGMPFARGVADDAGAVRVVDAAGQEVPSQLEVVSRWTAGGPVKWLRVDAVVVPSRSCFVEVSPSKGVRQSPSVELTRVDSGRVLVRSGKSAWVLGKGPSPVLEVWDAEGRQVATAAKARGLYVVDQRGELAVASADEEVMEVEASGPIATSVRFEGWYVTTSGERLARHITRIENFAGEAGASITHTLVLSRSTNEVWFKEIGWEWATTEGPSPSAYFGKNRFDWKAIKEVALTSGVSATYMLQERHQFLGHDVDKCRIGAIDALGRETTKMEGAEIGDWAALKGALGGMAVACKDAARQHPKEFEIARGRTTIRLFSNRRGELLDFRTPALIEKWDLKGWYIKTHSSPLGYEAFEKEVASLNSDAIGWAKTHQLFLMPLEVGTTAEEIAEAVRSFSKPIYASADPWVIYASGAMGPLYPADEVRFGEVERAVMAAFRHFAAEDAAWGENGFVDYFAGPHFEYSGARSSAGMFRYTWGTYTLRSDLWLLYARTGNRAVREFAEGTARTFMDMIEAHWDGKETIRGLHRSDTGRKSELPFYWGDRLALELASSSDHGSLLDAYYLTGYRRAKDCMQEYVEGLKRAWTPAKAERTGRPLMLFRLITQAYGATYDERLKEMAAETFRQLEDPAGVLGLRSGRRSYGSTSYKTNVDVRAVIEGWETFGDEKYYSVARKLTEYWWQLLGTPPVIYANPQPRVGWWLFNETGKPVYPEVLALQLRRLAETYNPVENQIRPDIGLGAETAAPYFEGVPYILDTITRAGADRKRLTSWLGFDDGGTESSLIVRKTTEPVELQISVEGEDRRNAPIGGARVRMLGQDPMGSTGGVRISESAPDFQGYHSGSIRVSIPKDAPPGDYEVQPGRNGSVFAVAESMIPLVFYAPGYWLPTLRQVPPERYYFSVTAGTTGAEIFFEGAAKLYEPGGTQAFGGKSLRGWTKLPADRPGVWSFEPVKNMLVRVRNLPPFFSVGDERSHFLPVGKKWARTEAGVGVRSTETESESGPAGASDRGGGSILLNGKRRLVVSCARAKRSGKASECLPAGEGTIEFWMKPSWSSAELITAERAEAGRTRLVKRLLRGKMASADPNAGYFLDYIVDGATKVLRGSFLSRSPDGTARVWAAVHNVLLERDEWVHVAWVWGRRRHLNLDKEAVEVLTSRLFVNGKAGRQSGSERAAAWPEAPMTILEVGQSVAEGNIDAVVSKLRISDAERYTEDFIPSGRKFEDPADEHTMALVQFSGGVDRCCVGWPDGTLASLEEK